MSTTRANGLSDADVDQLIRDVLMRAGGRLIHRMRGATSELLYHKKLGEAEELDRLATRLRAFVSTGKFDHPAG